MSRAPKPGLKFRLLFGRCLGMLSLVFLACSSNVDAQSDNVVRRPLSLEECIGLALEHNLKLQIARASPQIARYTLKATRGIYDPVFSLTGRKIFLNDPAQFDAKKAGISTEYEIDLTSFGPGLSGRLPFGLIYALSSISTYEHASSVFNTNVFDPNAQIFSVFASGLRTSNAWFNVTGVTLSQPLLKDFWIDIYRRNIQVNKLGLHISELAFKRAVMETVASVETAYYDLLLVRDQVKVQEKALNVAQQFLAQIQKQVNAGALADLEARRAESAVETARSALVGAEGQYTIQKNNLKNLLTDDLSSWIQLDIEPVDQLTAQNEPGNLQQQWSNALAKRPDFLIAELAVEQEEIDLRYLYNQLFPSLNLFGTYGWYTFNHSFSGHLDDVKHGANAYYSAGMILSFPLGNTAARNYYKRGKVSKKEGELTVTKLRQEILKEVETTRRTVETAFTQIASTRRAREYSEAALDAQTKQFQTGNTNSFVVLQFQGYLTDARYAELRSVADYNKAKSKLALSEGTTLEKHRINVKVH